jgi:hypothetical protein
MQLNTFRSSTSNQASHSAAQESLLLGSVLLQLDGDNLSGYVVIRKNGDILQAEFSESLEAATSGAPLVCEITACLETSEDSASTWPASQAESFQSPITFLLHVSRRLIHICTFGAFGGQWLTNSW